jgi:hypothetical protein
MGSIMTGVKGLEAIQGYDTSKGILYRLRALALHAESLHKMFAFLLIYIIYINIMLLYKS